MQQVVRGVAQRHRVIPTNRNETPSLAAHSFFLRLDATKAAVDASNDFYPVNFHRSERLYKQF